MHLAGLTYQNRTHHQNEVKPSLYPVETMGKKALFLQPSPLALVASFLYKTFLRPLITVMQGLLVPLSLGLTYQNGARHQSEVQPSLDPMEIK